MTISKNLYNIAPQISIFLNLKNYIPILLFLFLTGASNIYGNTLPVFGVDNFYEQIQNDENDVLVSSENVFIKTSKEKEDNTLFIELLKYEEVETNEEPSKHQLTSFYGYIVAMFSSKPLSAMSKELQKDVIRYVSHFDSTSTRLHVKFQVFII